MNKNSWENLMGVNVYLEGPRRRKYVGLLRKLNEYYFMYDGNYFKDEKVIPLGPDLPFTQRMHISSSIFPSFLDGIPEKQNPAYASYCEQFGINVDEDDILILLSTIGHRGPSSFVFEPLFKKEFSAVKLKQWREWLELSTREFAAAFEISQPSLVKIENGKASGKEFLRRFEIFYNFPEVCAWHINTYGQKLHFKTKERILNKLLENFTEK